MRKRLLSLMLSLAVGLTLMPAAAFAEYANQTAAPIDEEQKESETFILGETEESEKEGQPEESERLNDSEQPEEGESERVENEIVMYTGYSLHKHSLCCDSSCEEHNDMDWQELFEVAKNADEEYSIYSGRYYLSRDFEFDAPLCIYGDVTLCLNGHSITVSSKYDETISVKKDAVFTLTDCNGSGYNKGKVTHKDGVKGPGVYVDCGTFNMYGGSISGNTVENYGSGVRVTNGTFNMYGGTIRGNTSKVF